MIQDIREGNQNHNGEKIFNWDYLFNFSAGKKVTTDFDVGVCLTNLFNGQHTFD